MEHTEGVLKDLELGRNVFLHYIKNEQNQPDN
jgi:hypothetical protein